MMMAIGPYIFSLNTSAYQSIERDSEYRWESQERLGRHPALQWIGEGHETIALEGVVYPEFRGGLGQVAAMRALARSGAPHLLVSGLGDVLGWFAILKVSEKGTVFHRNGAPRKIEFALELKSYGPDGVG